MKHVLIVEDYEDTRRLLDLVAADCKFLDIKTLSNGPDALSYIGDCTNELDAVVIDLAMYPMDGISLAENIRLLERTAIRSAPLHLAFFTAQIVDELIERVIREVRARPVVFCKPCDTEQLFQEIKLWLEEN